MSQASAVSQLAPGLRAPGQLYPAPQSQAPNEPLAETAEEFNRTVQNLAVGVEKLLLADPKFHETHLQYTAQLTNAEQTAQKTLGIAPATLQRLASTRKLLEIQLEGQIFARLLQADEFLRCESTDIARAKVLRKQVLLMLYRHLLSSAQAKKGREFTASRCDQRFFKAPAPQ
jgi:hypothetical protein